MEQHLAGVIGLFTGVMLLSYWLHYCMGNPMAKDVESVDVRAILFFIPRWLSDNRLAHQFLLAELWERHVEELKLEKDPVRARDAGTEFERDRYESGRKFFAWEKSFLCPICLHFWLSVLVGLLCLIFDWLHLREHVGAAVLTYLVNHFFIRKIA